MKSLVLSLFMFASLLCPGLVQGQQAFLSLGGEIGLPNSTGLKMVAGTLTGGSLRFESSFGKKVAGIATLGYLVSSEQQPYSSFPGTRSTYRVMPLHAGIKYYTKEKGSSRNGLFLSAELGLLFTSTRFRYISNPAYNRRETDLAFAPGIGYLVGKFEPGFRLQYDLTDAGFKIYYYNLRIAYAFTKHGTRN